MKPQLAFIQPSGEPEDALTEDASFQVAILPATLRDTAWWKIWGALALLNRRPAILVYAQEASFQLWSGVLESGGYDVIVEPFSGEELRGAVVRAARSFEERCLEGL
jgi:DNA-binding response OmpR family regulator